MDPLKGAIALQKYIKDRKDAGLVPAPKALPLDASTLPNIDAWLNAFGDSDVDLVDPE